MDAEGKRSEYVDIRTIRAVAFDCYGTLINFDERNFVQTVQKLLSAHGINHISENLVWDKWMDSARNHAKSIGRDPMASIDGPEPPFYRFAEIWPQHFKYAFENTKVSNITPETALAFFFDQLSQAPAYEESWEILLAIQKAGYRTAIASNADDAHIYPVLRRAGIHVDLVVTSESVKSYKPRRPFFEKLCGRLDLKKSQVLFVGDSLFSDIRGARNAGLPAYWVQRTPSTDVTEILPYHPNWIYPDLRGLHTVLLGNNE